MRRSPRKARCRFVFITNPSTTHFTFSEALLRRLSGLAPIAAVKMPMVPDPAADVAHWCAALPGLTVGYSGDWGCSAALLAGAPVWFSVVGGILPRQARALAEAARRGDHAERARLEAHFVPLWALMKAHGGLRVAYAIAAHLGLTKTAPPLPVQPMPPSAEPKLRAALDVLAQIS